MNGLESVLSHLVALMVGVAVTLLLTNGGRGWRPVAKGAAQEPFGYVVDGVFIAERAAAARYALGHSPTPGKPLPITTVFAAPADGVQEDQRG